MIRWTCRGGWRRGCRWAARWWRIFNSVVRAVTRLRCCRLGRLGELRVYLLEWFFWLFPESCQEREDVYLQRPPPHPHVMSAYSNKESIWPLSLWDSPQSCSFSRSFFGYTSNVSLECHFVVVFTPSISTSSLVLSWRESNMRWTCAWVLPTSISHLLPQATMFSIHPGHSCCFVLPVITV